MLRVRLELLTCVFLVFTYLDCPISFLCFLSLSLAFLITRLLGYLPFTIPPLFFCSPSLLACFAVLYHSPFSRHGGCVGCASMATHLSTYIPAILTLHVLIPRKNPFLLTPPPLHEPCIPLFLHPLPTHPTLVDTLIP
ncbi:hypothetical protein H2248_012314 [Termitomyces sp. 'cryptogamus']|nr:hypothetical protein H2248_012314 [Termitomyces sp. 'cryptogamus']